MELLDELLKLSAEKEIPYTKKQLEKMNDEKRQAIYDEYKRKELDEFNESVTDMVIFKLDELMRKREWIKEDSELGKKLQNKKLFRGDLKNSISCITPVLPFIGFIEGLVTVVCEVVDKMGENKNVPFDEEKTPGDSEAQQ